MKRSLLATLGLVFAAIALPAFAEGGLHVVDPYARVIGPSGAAYFRLMNQESTDDVLVSATSPDAGMVMLMHSAADANGVMQMQTEPDGFAVKAGEEYVLGSSGSHVMLMGLTHPIKGGDMVTLVLTFKQAGEVTVTLPVDNKRVADPGMGPTPHDAASQ
jgi:hypothetical protein